MREIEKDSFPFEFLSKLAERESWRKEIHRPVYHVHKWWAKRLGSVFRGVLLGAALDGRNVSDSFYEHHSLQGVVFDPFMGSGTTVGEAHKLGLTSLGRDINPVAEAAVRVALGPMDRNGLRKGLVQLLDDVGQIIQSLYKSSDSRGQECDVLYYFWVMQADCSSCGTKQDLFSSYVIAANAYPKKKPEVQVLCPKCGHIACAPTRHHQVVCDSCSENFDPESGPVHGAKATCISCSKDFSVAEAVRRQRPLYRLYGKLVLTRSGAKEYLAATEEDQRAYHQCEGKLAAFVDSGEIDLPSLQLEDGHNTRQAIGYGFRAWKDFFNNRQLLALGLLRKAILKIDDPSTRSALMNLFSGTLEFNNMFTSYKGEGTGAVRHMFSHHILKPERTPIEANLWGTPKSSGAFTSLFKGRLLRAIDYREAPTEVNGEGKPGVVSSPPFSGKVEDEWPVGGEFRNRAIYVSCGDSARSDLPNKCIDFVVTDPPFFNNVHYAELADFFIAWRDPGKTGSQSTRSQGEVQDANAEDFSRKLQGVLIECERVLKDDGLLIFTYHHSRAEGWSSLTRAILGAGFVVMNSHPVKAEMSVAQPKLLAKDPIQVDIIIVCRKARSVQALPPTSEAAIAAAKAKIRRMEGAGFRFSRNDSRVTFFGQLLTTVRSVEEVESLEALVEGQSLTPSTTAQSEIAA